MPINQYKGRIVSATQVTPQTYGASGEWSLNQQFQSAGAGTWPLQPLAISRSLRFNSADSAYLNRTPAGAGTLNTWTFSFWMKRGTLGVNNYIYNSGTVNQQGTISFASDNKLYCTAFNSTGANAGWASTAVFRDPSAWYRSEEQTSELQ